VATHGATLLARVDSRHIRCYSPKEHSSKEKDKFMIKEGKFTSVGETRAVAKITINRPEKRNALSGMRFAKFFLFSKNMRTTIL